MQSRVCEFNAQDFANTARAFATLGQRDQQLFTALAQDLKSRGCEFDAQDLANKAKTFATLGQLDDKLFTALAQELAQYPQQSRQLFLPSHVGPRIPARLNFC